MVPAYLSQLLTDAPAVGTDVGPGRLECRVIGDLNLPSGRIVACDPMVEPDLPPFAETVPPGRWPVGVTIAHAQDDQRIAAAWIRVSAAEPVRWTPAQRAGRPQRESPAYGVDSGTGGFVSAEGALVFAAQVDDESVEAFQSALEAEYVPTREWAVVPIAGTDGLNIAAFSSGLGDGSYESFWGYGADGAIVCLLTDFRIVEPPSGSERASRVEGPLRPWWKFW
jgi:hypothetical protein